MFISNLVSKHMVLGFGLILNPESRKRSTTKPFYNYLQTILFEDNCVAKICTNPMLEFNLSSGAKNLVLYIDHIAFPVECENKWFYEIYVLFFW